MRLSVARIVLVGITPLIFSLFTEAVGADMRVRPAPKTIFKKAVGATDPVARHTKRFSKNKE
jgi:hypothetical protein